ncbi:acyltransferase family protein [Spiroplasma endosymbiont of Nebria brevicollis]|uniref:acyltransferase family protein n=1 Tax=Spiroplasma endosymbiont of Nebria brevicollis TaxID=3066284 RepID=UPI00313CA2F1
MKIKISKDKIVRNSKYELLRFICSLMIIMLHIKGHEKVPENWLFANSQIICNLPVIMFMFLTGFFLVNSNKTRFWYILSTIIIYYFLNLIIGYLIIYYDNLNHCYSTKDLFFGGRDWWYLWTLPIIYLLSPFINLSIKTINKWYFINSLLIIYILFSFFSNLEYNIFGAGQLLFLIIIYCLGAWYKINFEQFGLKKIVFILAIIFLFTLQIINNLLFCFKNILLPITTSNFLSVLSTLALFIIFQNIKIKQNIFLNYIGKLSLPIYLFHYLFEFIIMKNIMSNIDIDINLYPSLFLLIYWTICFLITFIFSLIILYPSNFLILNFNNFLLIIKNKILFISEKIKKFNNEV